MRTDEEMARMAALERDGRMMAPTENAAKKQFYTSLERTGAGFFDYYLLHAS